MMAVPWFFLASGFFLAGHLGEYVGWWKNEVAKRVRSLVIPFYIWMVISFLFGVIIWYVKVHVFNMQPKENPLSLSPSMFMLKMLGVHPVEDIGVFWYMRCLFFMVLISPVLHWLMRWKGMVLAILSGLFLVVSWCFDNGVSKDFYFFFDRFVSIRGFVYFFLGILLRTQRQTVERQPSQKRSVFTAGINRNIAIGSLMVGILLLIVDNCIAVSGCYAWTGVFEAVLVPFLIVGVFGMMSESRFPRWITGSSFPIFLMHNIFLSLSSLGFKMIGMYGNAQYDLEMMFSRAFIAIVCSIAVSAFMHRYLLRASTVLFGGR